jgi:Skp family chaperone for outer membrane proteins
MIEQLIFEFIAGAVVGVLGGTVLIYAIGRTVSTIRDKMVDMDLEDVRKEHNKNIQKTQKEYDAKRSKFLSRLGEYRQKIRKMEIIDREKVKELYTGDEGDATQTS